MINSSYIFFMAGSALICAGTHFFLTKGLRRRGWLTALTLVLGIMLGVICGKLLYGLARIEFLITEGFWDAMFSAHMSEISYYGGMLGVCLGAVLAAKLTGNQPLPALNAYAPAGALMAALARFAEYFLGMLCTGRIMDEESPLCFFPVAVQNKWGEWRPTLYFAAGLCYLAVFILSLTRFQKHRFLRTLFYLFLPQIVLESLRDMSILVYEFVRVEQLLCMIGMEVIYLIYAAKAKPHKGRFLPALVGLVCAGVFVAAEFALDKTAISNVLIYLVMILGLGALAAAECYGYRIAYGKNE